MIRWYNARGGGGGGGVRGEGGGGRGCAGVAARSGRSVWAPAACIRCQLGVCLEALQAPQRGPGRIPGRQAHFKKNTA